MAKRDLTGHQQKIVKRYYEHLDTIALARLGEIVSELYLAEGKKAEQLWGRAEKALAKVSANEVRVRRILEERDLEGLARLVGDAGR